MLRARFIVAAAFMLGLAAPAHADCTISVTGVAFGTYDPMGASQLDGTGSVRLDCRHNDDPIVSIGPGGSGNQAARRMANGADTLQYNLFTDAARTVTWGNGTGGTATHAPPVTQSVGLRRIRQSPIYGRIPPRQNVRAGTYSDSLFVTVSF